MISFFFYTYRFIKIMLNGIRNDPEFRFLLTFIILLLTCSTVFYSKYEGWTAVDSLYFSVMTMSTVGYGDFTPTTPASKIFTIIFTFLSIGVFVAFTAKVVRIAFDTKPKKKSKKEA